jgi:hypothetical protein
MGRGRVVVRRGLLLKDLQKGIQQDPTVPVRRLYDKAAADATDESDALVPTFCHIRSRAKRYRSRFMPAIPRRIEDVCITGEWGTTWTGRKFLIHLDNASGIAIFSSKRMTPLLQTCKTLFADGTFRTAPHPYEQLMTVHALYHGFIVPVAFCLLTTKTVAAYQQVFIQLKTLVFRKTRHRMKPTNFVVDFEQSLMAAIETEYANCRIRVCYFHFTQSLWRRIQNLGLAGIELLRL